MRKIFEVVGFSKEKVNYRMCVVLKRKKRWDEVNENTKRKSKVKLKNGNI